VLLRHPFITLRHSVTIESPAERLFCTLEDTEFLWNDEVDVEEEPVDQETKQETKLKPQASSMVIPINISAANPSKGQDVAKSGDDDEYLDDEIADTFPVDNEVVRNEIKSVQTMIPQLRRTSYDVGNSKFYNNVGVASTNPGSKARRMSHLSNALSLTSEEDENQIAKFIHSKGAFNRQETMLSLNSESNSDLFCSTGSLRAVIENDESINEVGSHDHMINKEDEEEERKGIAHSEMMTDKQQELNTSEKATEKSSAQVGDQRSGKLSNAGDDSTADFHGCNNSQSPISNIVDDSNYASEDSSRIASSNPFAKKSTNPFSPKSSSNGNVLSLADANTTEGHRSESPTDKKLTINDSSLEDSSRIASSNPFAKKSTNPFTPKLSKDLDNFSTIDQDNKSEISNESNKDIKLTPVTWRSENVEAPIVQEVKVLTITTEASSMPSGGSPTIQSGDIKNTPKSGSGSRRDSRNNPFSRVASNPWRNPLVAQNSEPSLHLGTSPTFSHNQSTGSLGDVTRIESSQSLGGSFGSSSITITGITSSPTTSETSVASEHRKSIFKVGDLIEARFMEKETFYKGSIKHVNVDGTYNISYEDGDEELRVHETFCRSVI
jgi:hypothetical protein